MCGNGVQTTGDRCSGGFVRSRLRRRVTGKQVDGKVLAIASSLLQSWFLAYCIELTGIFITKFASIGPATCRIIICLCFS